MYALLHEKFNDTLIKLTIFFFTILKCLESKKILYS